jgi:hypothetical protein
MAALEPQPASLVLALPVAAAVAGQRILQHPVVRLVAVAAVAVAATMMVRVAPRILVVVVVLVEKPTTTLALVVLVLLFSVGLLAQLRLPSVLD